MNLVDSCGWLEYFAGGSNASFFAPAIEDTSKLIVPSITILEVFKRVAQQRGESVALDAITAMHQGRIIDLDAGIALLAARIGSELRLPLADSVIVASARTYGAIVWTQDSDLQGIEGVKYIASKKRT